MAKDVFTITCSGLPDSARLAGFRGTEAISTLYHFDVFVLVGADGDDLDLGDVVGTKAKLTLDRQDGRAPFAFCGVIAAFELLHQFGDRSLCQAVLVPQLWQLTQSLHSRVWTNKSIPDVIKDVLTEGGLGDDDFELHLTASYAVEEHVCQYRESDFDFISRWMEREGMYYSFEHGDQSEKLIITDSKSSQTTLDPKPVRFAATSSHDGSAGEALQSFRCKHRALPSAVKLRDYDYAKPTLDVSGSASVTKQSVGEIHVYGSRFFTPGDGARIAQLRADELLARQVLYRGAGTEFLLRSGYVFELDGHPRASFDAKYLVTAIEHSCNQQIGTPEMRELTGIVDDRVYWIELTAIPATVQFRAESKTPWPRVFGYENGTVCGPADSDYAQIDDAGRYNVKFKFDESDLKNGKASTFVRMMQPHGGSPEGFHFPLRKGTEIVFTFLGGDPDRPVIAGVVPDAHNPSPVTKGNHTLNVVQTGARNRWELEDKQGQERITMITPHENSFFRMGYPNKGHTMIVQTNKATLLNAGTDFDVQVGQIGGAGTWDAKVKTDWTNTVENGGFTLAVGAAKEPATAGEFDLIAKNDIFMRSQSGDYWRLIDSGKSTTTVKGDTALTVQSGNHTVDVATGYSKTTVDAGDWTTKVSAGASLLDTATTTTIKSGGLISITSTGDDITMTANHVKTTSTADVLFTIGGNSVTKTTGITSTLTMGVTNSVFIGVQNSASLSMANSLAVGLSHSLFVGGKMSISVAQEINVTAAARFNLEASISVTIAAALSLKMVPAKIEQQLNNMQHALNKTNIAGLTVVL